jgi:uncharacterized protein YdeI (YjbR/CyaY-like superfamily)
LKDSFHQLSKAKHRDYIIYVAEAKQEATKQKRIEKISPQILNGMGLNEKYKR